MTEIRLNCWEAFNCGRELGGIMAYEFGVCPASTDVRFDSIHYGINAGRELDEDNHCRDCGNHFPEHPDEEHVKDRLWKDRETDVSATEGLEDFMKALRR